MKLAVVLALVVRAALAKATAALNHATARTISAEAQAEVISQLISSEVLATQFGLSLNRQDLANVIHSQVLAYGALLDEQNLWAIIHGEETAWSYQTFEDALVSVLTATLADASPAADADVAHIEAGSRSDSVTAGDEQAAHTAWTGNEGSIRSYFAGDYSLEEYDGPDGPYEDYSWAALVHGRTDTVGVTDATASAHTPSASEDSHVASDAIAAGMQAPFAEGTTRTYFAGDYALSDYNAPDNSHEDTYLAAHATGAADAHAPSDASTASTLSVFAEGTLRTYFASDYDLGDYNAFENSQSDSFLTVLAQVSTDVTTTTDALGGVTTAPASDAAVVYESLAAVTATSATDTATTADAAAATLTYPAWTDSPSFADATVVSTLSVFAEGTTRTYFASDYDLGDYNAPDNSHEDAYAATSSASTADTSTSSDAAAADLTYPAWADSAVPVDSVAIALTVAAQDSATTGDAASAEIQNYALDPSYFLGDYATTTY